MLAIVLSYTVVRNLYGVAAKRCLLSSFWFPHAEVVFLLHSVNWLEFQMCPTDRCERIGRIEQCLL